MYKHSFAWKDDRGGYRSIWSSLEVRNANKQKREKRRGEQKMKPFLYKNKHKNRYIYVNVEKANQVVNQDNERNAAWMCGSLFAKYYSMNNSISERSVTTQSFGTRVHKSQDRMAMHLQLFFRARKICHLLPNAMSSDIYIVVIIIKRKT